MTLYASRSAVARSFGEAAAAELETVDDRTCRWRAGGDTLDWLACG